MHSQPTDFRFSIRNHNYYTKETTVSGRHRNASSSLQSCFALCHTNSYWLDRNIIAFDHDSFSMQNFEVLFSNNFLTLNRNSVNSLNLVNLPKSMVHELGKIKDAPSRHFCFGGSMPTLLTCNTGDCKFEY